MTSYLRRSPDADEFEEGYPTPRVSLNDDADASSAARQFAGGLRDSSAFERDEEPTPNEENDEASEPGDEPAGDSTPFESEVVEEEQLDVPEDDDESRDDEENGDENYSFQNTATLIIGQVTETTIETDSKTEVEKVEIDITEVTEEAEQDENTNESTGDSSAPPSAPESPAKRAPLTRDLTQTSVTKDPARSDESDWARRNQGRNKVLGLIAKFSDPTTVSNASTGYKTEHGIAKVGQIKQSKFQ